MATKTKLPTPAPRVPVRRALILAGLILGATAFGLLLSGSVWVAVAVGLPVALVGLAVHMIRRVKRVRSLLRSHAVPSGLASVRRSVGLGPVSRSAGRPRSASRSAGRAAGLFGRLRGAGPWSSGRRPVGQAVRSRLASLVGRSGQSDRPGIGRAARSAVGRRGPTAQVTGGRVPVGKDGKSKPRTRLGRALAAVGLSGRSGRSATRSAGRPGSRTAAPTGRGGRAAVGRSVGRRSGGRSRGAGSVGFSMPFGLDSPTARPGSRSVGRQSVRKVAWGQTRQFFRDYRLSWADHAEAERLMEESERVRVPVEVLEPMAPDFGPEQIGDNDELTDAERDELLDAEYAELDEAYRTAGSIDGAHELIENEGKAARRSRREDIPAPRVGTGRTQGARSMFGFQEVAGRISRWTPEKPTDTEKMLRDYPVELAEVAKAVEALAARFGSEYPYDEKVVAAFAATAKGLRMSAQMSETLAKDFRSKHASDFARHEEPRRNERHMNVD